MLGSSSGIPVRRFLPPYELDVASSSDMTHLLPLVEDVEEHHPVIHEDMNENAADKGYDSVENNAALFDDHGIKPVIDTRELWKNKPHETNRRLQESSEAGSLSVVES